MKITGVALRAVDVPLTRPYAVANHTTDTATIELLRLSTDAGLVGLGSATPEPEVNGDTRDAAHRNLLAVAEQLHGREVAAPEAFAALLNGVGSPGARMTLDVALHDLWAKAQGKPLVELLGRAHDAMPTSVTIGVGDVDSTLRDAREYLARGFTVLKVKIGEDLDLDVERLARLRELVGGDVRIRVDGNVGYRPAQLLPLLQRTQRLDLEFIEQPLPRAGSDAQRVLPAPLLAKLMADESLHDVADARALCAPPRAFGLFNIKLVKCGGIGPALEIAALAQAHGIGLMWGCMDESRIAIAAALHAAFACPATRYLDLDGHLDLAKDFAVGGFSLEQGVMRLDPRPGLGVVASGDW